MQILRSDLQAAARVGLITEEQGEKLWEYFEGLRPEQGRFQALHVIYYFGGILVLASMSWFLTTAWDSGPLVMAISAGFAAIYLIAGNSLWFRHQLKIPGGLLVTAAVGLVPVFVYGFQKATGLWPQGDPGSYHGYHVWVKGSWFFMELATILASIGALMRFRFTFLTFPLAVTLWYMSMDLTPLLFGRTDFTYDERKLVSVVFGFLMLVTAYWIDRWQRQVDFSFWLYLYGLLAFWGGLTAMNSDSEVGKAVYCLLNVVLIVLSVYLYRRVFIVFGTLGVLAYLSHLAYKVFKDSFFFPIVLALLGLLILYFGVLYQRNRARIEASVEEMLPTFLKKWRPQERA